MRDHLNFLVKRLREHLWIKPLVISALSIAAVFLADLLDRTDFAHALPDISKESAEALLKILASSMLVMATLAVASMVAAYASASRTATPRSFPLIIGDDVSQNALSAFIGAFIFSVVGLIALQNEFYGGQASQFVLFSLTLVVLVVVIITFIRWVDRIARLGQLGNTIDKVEEATAEALCNRRSAPRLGGIEAFDPPERCRAVFADSIGYLQRVDTGKLQELGEKSRLTLAVASLPGTFCTPNRPVAWAIPDASGPVSDEDAEAIADTFVIGDERVFDQDPRFGLVVLSEIASRALSPAVNDPGTAIDVTGTLVRLFVKWNVGGKARAGRTVKRSRVAVPELAIEDMFDDAFTGIARDGAGLVEVVVRLLEALETLAAVGDTAMRASALRHARLTLMRAERALEIPEDLEAVREAAGFAARAGS